MSMITTTDALREFCLKAATFDYVTVDTEFLREKTYYSKLCLVQLAYPEEGEHSAVCVDPLADGMDLTPLYDLFQDESVVKVFHAARQDLEIFYVDRQILPRPFFDTQVAAMVCGYGDQVGYETLVRKIAREPLDKSSRFTDWSARPLSERQMTYALGDVTHLRVIYETLAKRLAKTGRTEWVEEELQVLLDPETYIARPHEAWKRVKTRNASRKIMAVVRELAEFRESYAQTKNIPRNRVLKDDAIMELAATRPANAKALGKSRLLLREARNGPIADGILEAVKRGVECDPKNYPEVAKPREKATGADGLADLLRVLLKAKSEQADVAQKLIASSADLDAIAGGERPDHLFKGWRNKVFGADALRLCNGEVALSADGNSVKIIDV